MPVGGWRDGGGGVGGVVAIADHEEGQLHFWLCWGLGSTRAWGARRLTDANPSHGCTSVIQQPCSFTKNMNITFTS